MQPIILASQSPRRKKLLEQINLPFSIRPGSADESFNAGDPPGDIVQSLACRKASDMAQNHPRSLIIGADTIVVLHASILEKPSSPSHAKKMLSSLGGNTHKVYTGVALLKTGRTGNITETCAFFEYTKVTFGTLTPAEIEAYVQTENPMDKAGAYGIQDDLGSLFVERIEGDYNTVVGFPLYRFYQKMKQFAPEYLPKVSG